MRSLNLSLAFGTLVSLTQAAVLNLYGPSQINFDTDEDGASPSVQLLGGGSTLTSTVSFAATDFLLSSETPQVSVKTTIASLQVPDHRSFHPTVLHRTTPLTLPQPQMWQPRAKPGPAPPRPTQLRAAQPNHARSHPPPPSQAQSTSLTYCHYSHNTYLCRLN